MAQITSLSGQAEFKALFKDGVWIATPHLRLVSCAHNSGKCRMGYTASRKIGNAVTRNRLKRVSREFIRLTPEIPPMGDTLIIFGKGSGLLSNDDLRGELKNVFYKLFKRI
jgi:ribonuclease P protein component